MSLPKAETILPLPRKFRVSILSWEISTSRTIEAVAMAFAGGVVIVNFGNEVAVINHVLMGVERVSKRL